MFERVIVKKNIGIKVKKFTDHPVRVSCDPKTNSQVVTNLTHVLAGTKRNDN